MKKIYISYCSNDIDYKAVEHLVNGLKSEGYSVIVGNYSFLQTISPDEKRAIQKCDYFLPLITSNYFGNYAKTYNKQEYISVQVQEMFQAFKSERVIVPICAREYYASVSPRELNTKFMTDDDLFSDSKIIFKMEWKISVMNGVNFYQVDDFDDIDFLTCLLYMLNNISISEEEFDAYYDFLCKQEERINSPESEYGKTLNEKYINREVLKSYTSGERDKMSRMGRPNTPVTIMLEDMINQDNRYAVLFGEDGIGTTTALKMLCMCQTEKVLRCILTSQEFLPIFVECKYFTFENTNDIIQTISDMVGLPSKYIKYMLYTESNRFCKPLFLFDGIDEMAPKLFEKMKKQIKIRFGESKAIFSSKYYKYYETQYIDFSSLVPYYLKEFSFDQQEEYIRDIIKCQEFENAIFSRTIVLDKSFDKLLLNPQLVKMMIALYVEDNVLPTDLLDLIEKTSDIILEDRSIVNPKDKLIETKKVLGALAYRILLDRNKGKDNEHTQKNLRQIARIIGENEIIDENGFTNSLFVYYFASYYLYEYCVRVNDYSFINDIVYSDCWWCKTIELLLCYASKRYTELLMNLLEKLLINPDYTVLCEAASQCSRKLLMHKKLLASMMERSVKGIMTCEMFHQIYVYMKEGANPYCELFVYAVVYEMEKAIKEYEIPTCLDVDEDYTRKKLIKELYLLFDIDKKVDLPVSEKMPKVFALAAYTGAPDNEIYGRHYNYDGRNDRPRHDDVGLIIAINSLKIAENISWIERGYFKRYNSVRKIVADENNEKFYCKSNCLIEKDTKDLLLVGEKSVIPEEGVERIEEYAFTSCVSEKYLYIPENINWISSLAFYNCNLIHIDVHKDNKTYYSENNCVIERESKRVVVGCSSSEIPYDVKAIGNGAFTARKNITNISLPGNIDIEENAFSECSGLHKVYFNGSVQNIGNQAFYACENLHELRLPEGLLTIGSKAFDSCARLELVILPDSLCSIGKYAFSNCVRLSRIMLHENLTVVDCGAFDSCYNLKKVFFSEKTKEIHDLAFRHCYKLNNIVIPASVETIGKLAFCECISNDTVYICSSVIAESINKEEDAGCLLDVANHVYIKADIEKTGDYINNCFAKKDEHIYYEDNEYVEYIRVKK